MGRAAYEEKDRPRMEADVRETTLLDLIVELQRRGAYTETEIVSMITQLLQTGQIRLCGIYRKSRFALS